MDRTEEPESDQGMVFFGKMSVSVSHEIKNCLAIINENAGLLEDYSMMAEQGMPLDPVRLKTLSEKVKKQVRRSNKLILNLNSLARSSDSASKESNLGENLRLICELAERFASNKGVKLQPVIPERLAKIIGNSFRLNHLLWQCTEYAIHTAGEGSTITLTLTESADGVRVDFQPIELPDGSIDHQLIQTGTVKALLAELRASLTVDRQRGLKIVFSAAETP